MGRCPLGEYMHISQLDEAQLRHEMREMYRTQGFTVCCQALYEIVKAGEILVEVMHEEVEKQK